MSKGSFGIFVPIRNDHMFDHYGRMVYTFEQVPSEDGRYWFESEEEIHKTPLDTMAYSGYIVLEVHDALSRTVAS